MSSVMIARLLIASACFIAAGAWAWVNAVVDHDIRSRPQTVRYIDWGYTVTAMWGGFLMVWALMGNPPAAEVRAWLQWALPPIVLWPPIQRVWVVTHLSHRVDEE